MTRKVLADLLEELSNSSDPVHLFYGGKCNIIFLIIFFILDIIANTIVKEMKDNGKKKLFYKYYFK